MRVKSSVAAQAEGVVLFPGGPCRRVVVAMTFAQSPVLFPNAGETSGLATLVNGFCDPVDARVPTNSFVIGVDKDDFVILVNTVLIHPVGIQDSQIATASADALFCDTPQAALELEVVDTLTHGFAICSTLGHRFLAVTPSHADAIDNVTLLCLVS